MVGAHMQFRGPAFLVLCSLAFAAAGCGGSVPEPAVADPIRIDKAPPPQGAEPVGTLHATDGHGCGLFGTLGTYQGASAKLRDQARSLKADYVQITDVKEPYADHECVHKEYTLFAIAFRSLAAQKAAAQALPAASSAPSASSVAIAPVVATAQSTSCAAGRALEFSARSQDNAALGVWIDGTSDAAPSGLELRYEPTTREIKLVRFPEGKTIAVAENSVELGAAWHAWRLERTADKVAVWLDGKLVLLYAAPAPAGGGSFGLDADKVELRGVRPGCAGSAP
jgi:hypothetical protein